MKQEHLTRHADIIPIGKASAMPITIVGAGAIGSWVALLLAKSGFTNLTIYDHDTVDVVNMSSQGYRFKDIGMKKVHALARIIADHVPGEDLEKMAFIDTKYAPDIHTKGIVVNAADSMEVRAALYKDIKTQLFQVTHFIDSRMSAEQATLYCSRPHYEPWYENTLYTDSEAVQERCTAKATIYTACLLAGMVTQTIKQIVCDEPCNKILLWNIKDGGFDLFKTGIK